MSDPTDTPSTDGAPDPASVIAGAIEAWHDEWSGEDYTFHTIARGVVLDALAAAGFRVVPEDRPAPCPSLESVFVQLPSATEIARWFIETERAGEFQNLGGSSVRLSDDPLCSVWHLATVDHDEQMHYLLDVHTDGSHDLLYVTWGLREEMGCEWRQQPSDVMPWGYDALVWFAERIEFANENCGIALVWLDDLDEEPAGVPALDDDTRREVEACPEHGATCVGAGCCCVDKHPEGMHSLTEVERQMVADALTVAELVGHWSDCPNPPDATCECKRYFAAQKRLARAAAAYLGGTDG